MMMDRGALSVRALCTHPVLSGDAIERIEKSCLTEVVVTDTIPVRRPSEKFVVLSCAELFSNTIYKLLHDESISSQFIF
jgi:ribose-phosphate pyrophosphokinase